MQNSSLARCGALILVALVACGVPEGRVPQPAMAVRSTIAPQPPEPTAGQPPPPPDPSPAAAGDAQAAGWQTYRNEQAGYSIAYVPGWAVTEQQGPGGRAQVSFRGPDMRVRVVARSGPVDPAPTDLPNVRCVTVTVAGRAATRCDDPAARTAVTTVPDGERAIQIIADGKGYDAAVYQQYLDSFTLTSAPAG